MWGYRRRTSTKKFQCQESEAERLLREEQRAEEKLRLKQIKEQEKFLLLDEDKRKLIECYKRFWELYDKKCFSFTVRQLEKIRKKRYEYAQINEIVMRMEDFVKKYDSNIFFCNVTDPYFEVREIPRPEIQVKSLMELVNAGEIAITEVLGRLDDNTQIPFDTENLRGERDNVNWWSILYYWMKKGYRFELGGSVKGINSIKVTFVTAEEGIELDVIRDEMMKLYKNKRI